MARARWDSSATPDRGRGLRLENLALVPASLLLHKATYQRLANQLPAGAVLVVLPIEDGPEKRTLETAAARLRAKGHAIATLSVDEVLAQARRGRPATAPSTVPAPPQEPVGAPLSGPSPTDEADTVPPFTRELRLVRIDAGATPARFEVFQWQPTLWGGVALVQARGTLGTPPRTRVVDEAAAPELSDRVREVVRRRLAAGYRIADWQ